MAVTLGALGKSILIQHEVLAQDTITRRAERIRHVAQRSRIAGDKSRVKAGHDLVPNREPGHFWSDSSNDACAVREGYHRALGGERVDAVL
jgi:hypothetical protein